MRNEMVGGVGRIVSRRLIGLKEIKIICGG